MNGRREEADETRIRQRWRTDNQNKNRGETKKCGERDEREQKREEADNGDGQRIKIKQWTEERQKSVGTICWRHITFSGMRGREMNGNWEEKKQRRLESDYGDGRRIKKFCDQRREKKWVRTMIAVVSLKISDPRHPVCFPLQVYSI